MKRFAVTGRAFRRVHSYNPVYFPLSFLKIIFQQISPYFNLWMSAEIVTALYEGRERADLYQLVAVTLAGNAVVQIAGALLGRAARTASESLKNNEAAAFYQKTLSLDYEKIENPEVRKLRRKIIENSWINSYGVNLMGDMLESLFTNLVDLVFSAALFAEMILFLTRVPFRWLGVLLLLAMAGLTAADIVLRGRNMKKVSTYWDGVTEVLLEENRISPGYSVAGTDNRIYRQQTIIDRVYEKSNRAHRDAFSRAYAKIFVLMLPVNGLIVLSKLCSYLAVCFYCILGAFPAGSIIKYVGYLGRLTGSIGNIFYALNSLKTNEHYLKPYLEYFDIANDMYQGSLAVEKRSDKEFEIEFRDVSFRYPESVTNNDAGNVQEEAAEDAGSGAAGSAEVYAAEDAGSGIAGSAEVYAAEDAGSGIAGGAEVYAAEDAGSSAAGSAEAHTAQDRGQWALRNISIQLMAGERLAVVGMNGSGKTTFIKLLCRLYDPTEGEILMNDFNIRKYDYRQYLDLFSVVFQDYNLLAVPLGNNISSDASWDTGKAEQLLEEVGFGERYRKMERGLNTPLYKNFDEDGVNVSGGEAQKIALARALYRDAPFIILDEPTAALDPIAEAEIYSRFDEIVGDKTAIYISHRLSSCRFCDKIAVFDCGRIVQVGTHEELLAEIGGKYYELWNAQAQYYA